MEPLEDDLIEYPPPPKEYENRSLSIDLSTAVAAIAVSDFLPVDSEDLAMSKGDVVQVLERDDSGWWKGYNNEKVGIFPANLVSINGIIGPAPTSLEQHQEPTKKYNYEVLTKYSEMDVNSVPSDVDLNYLEKYLPEQEFEKKFSMTMRDFGELPLWKRNQLKRQKNLFGDTLRLTKSQFF